MKEIEYIDKLEDELTIARRRIDELEGQLRLVCDERDVLRKVVAVMDGKSLFRIASMAASLAIQSHDFMRTGCGSPSEEDFDRMVEEAGSVADSGRESCDRVARGLQV